MVEPAHLIGRTISHYRILAKLGQGGMGEVYRARDTSLHRDIALKVLPQAIVVDPLRRQRFVREARAASALEHPHIAVIHEIGEDQGVTSIAMELVRGEPLDALAMAVLNIVFLMRGLALVLPIAPAVDQGKKARIEPDIRQCSDRGLRIFVGKVACSIRQTSFTF